MREKVSQITDQVVAASPKAGTKVELFFNESELETRREVLVNLQEGCENTRLNSIATENVYQANLSKFNGNLQGFHKNYNQLLE